MMGIDPILKYFPSLTPEQQEQFGRLPELYRHWNEQINVISRKDIDNLMVRHVLHSLALAKVFDPKPGAEILDLGTGGGFPGIPLAILFPQATFLLVDGTGKKIRVVNEVVQSLGLQNAECRQQRAEELKGRRFDFIVTRAVARLEKLTMWTQQRLFKKKQMHAMPNGLFALKGGALKEEIAELPKGNYVETWKVSEFFEEPYFAEKQIVYVQA
jgi:16S rRNA (guanine527-N7)-methyltransferase